MTKVRNMIATIFLGVNLHQVEKVNNAFQLSLPPLVPREELKALDGVSVRLLHETM